MHEVCGILVSPKQGSNSHTLHWKLRVLSTGSPGKSQKVLVHKRDILRYLGAKYDDVCHFKMFQQN